MIMTDERVRVTVFLPRRLYALCRYFSAGRGGISVIVAEALEMYFSKEKKEE